METKEYLSTAEVATLTGLSKATLDKARCTRTGLGSDLAFIQLGRRIVYRRADVLAWLERHLVRPETC